MHFLVTGGYGYVGSFLVKELLDNNHEVTILSHQKHDIEPLHKARFLKADIRSLEDCKIISGLKFDACVHCASLNEGFLPDYPRRALEINALGTRNIAQVWSDSQKGRFLYFSTFHVYGRSHGEVIENLVPAPRHDYALTHLFAEEYLKMLSLGGGLNFSTFRLSNGFGVPMHKDSTKWHLVLNDFCKSAVENKKIVMKSNGLALRDFIHLKDVASIVRICLEENKLEDNEVYNLASSQTFSMLDLAHAVQSAYKLRYNQDIMIERNLEDKTEPRELKVCSRKLQKIHSFKPNLNFESEAQNLFELLVD